MDENTQQHNETPKLDQQAQMVNGSLWLSAGNLLSRLLGAIYIIPWFLWMGEHGNEANGLFSMGYNIYALFLLISTAGIPSAIAKQTAYYNSKREYKTSRQLFYTGLKTMGGLGLIFAGFMYLASPFLAEWAGGGEELIPVMRSLAIAVLVFPCMSVIRGYFQGNNQMKPVAVSQVIEQVARVFYMLLTTFIIMRVMNGQFTEAVVQSTFAAFIGMLASFIVLIWYMIREKPVLDEMEKRYGQNTIHLNSKDLLAETIRQAVPFIIVGSGVQLFQIVDQYTFYNIMSWRTDYSRQELLNYFAMFSANPNKLTMVIVALATSISGTGLPLITENYTLGKKQELATLIVNNIQLFLFVMLPSAVGMMILAFPLYTVFFGANMLGANLLAWVAAQSLLLGFYMLISNMLQGMYQNRYAIQCLGIGLIVKIATQFLTVSIFQVHGPILSTFLGFAVACWFLMKRVRGVSKFNYVKVIRRSILMGLMTIAMAIATLVARGIFGLFLSNEHRVSSLILVLLCAIVGGVVYMYLSLKTRLADKLLGARVNVLRRRLKMK